MDIPRGPSSSSSRGKDERKLSSASRQVREAAASAGRTVTSRRISGFSIAMLIVLVVGAFTIIPTIQKVVDQRAQINATQASIEQSKARIKELNAANQRWLDPAYVKAQARSRLFLVVPGERAFITLTDGATIQPDTKAQVAQATKTVKIVHSSWSSTLLQSIAASTAVSASK